MAINKGKPDAGKGGKLGRSNMAYWGTNAEEKESARKRRRIADRDALEEGLADAAERGLIGFISDQLSGLGDLLVKPMFGGAGIYLDGQFFGIFSKGRLYFRVSARSVAEYKARRMKPFKPFESKGTSRHYYEVPVDVLENPDDLVKWAKVATDAARSAPSRRPATRKRR